MKDKKVQKKIATQTDFTHFQIFFSIKKELHCYHHKNLSCITTNKLTTEKNDIFNKIYKTLKIKSKCTAEIAKITIERSTFV